MNRESKVSICCITFNHEPFIKKCLDGFLMQQVDFPIEILIHDDASTDGTKEIIQAYADKYPGIIYPIFQTENQYSRGIRSMNARFNFPRANGKYIALCEGDDYWTDPLKLQKQVSFLEKNPNIVVAGHDSILVDGDDQLLQTSTLTEDQKRGCSAKDLQRCFGILTQTMCFRNSPELRNMPQEVYNVSNGDKFLISFLGQFGDYEYMPDILPSAYRLHKGGIWSAISELNRCKMMTVTYFNLKNYYSRIKNKDIAFFHGLKVFVYSKKTVKLTLQSSVTPVEKIKSIWFFFKQNNVLTRPFLFLKTLSYSFQKRFSIKK